MAGGRYIVQNNEWGDSTPPCVNATDDGLAITTASHTIVGQGSNRYVDMSAAGTADGTPVQVWDCDGTGAQLWRRTGTAFVNPNGTVASLTPSKRSFDSGKCLLLRRRHPGNQVWWIRWCVHATPGAFG